MNGSELGQRGQNAREMTEEIDRAASIEAATQNRQRQPHALDREQAGDFGNRILTYNPDLEAGNKGVLENKRVREMAEAENGFARQAMENVGTVGAETKVQAQEWLKEDREDVANEQGLNGPYVKNLMDRNNKRITNEAVAAVDDIISKNEYHPGQLDELMNRTRTKFLKDVFNRILGSRN